MAHLKIDSEEWPLVAGESWWIMHPNSSGEFQVPKDASTICIKNFFDYGFKQNTVYRVYVDECNDGWVNVINADDTVEMPQYLFARYFDANIFIRCQRKNIMEYDRFTKEVKLGKWTD